MTSNSLDTRGLVLDQKLVGQRIDLTDDRRLARFDMREERVEQPSRALRVLPRPECLLEVGEDPHDRSPRHVADDLLHPSLEHADVHLAGVDFGGAGLEREPGPTFEPSQRLDDQCRLAHALLTHE